MSIPQSVISKTREWASIVMGMTIGAKTMLLLTMTVLVLSCNLPIPGADTSTLPGSSTTIDVTTTVTSGTAAPLSITVPPPPLDEIEAVTPTIMSSSEVTTLTDIISYDDLDEILMLTNQARCKRGLSPLTGNLLLGNAAAQHNIDMLLNNYFDHNGSDGSTVGDRVSMQDYAWLAVGENLAAGSTSAAETFDLWWASPGHKANLLNADFREGGLSHLFQAGSEWGHYWTMVFANQGTDSPTCAELGF